MSFGKNSSSGNHVALDLAGRSTSFASSQAAPIGTGATDDARFERGPSAVDAHIAFPRRTILVLNLSMGIFHSGLIAATLVLGNRDLSVKVFATSLEFVRNNDTRSSSEPAFDIIPSYVQMGTLPFTWLTAAFFMCSALAHLGNATVWRGYYERELAQCRTPTRFTEYFFSASIMMLLIAYSAGVRDYTQLLGVTALTAATMPYGFLTEILAEPVIVRAHIRHLGTDLTAEPSTTAAWKRPLRIRLLPYMLGHVPQLAAWAIVMANFYDGGGGSGRAPFFVHIIVWAELVLFFSFGGVQLWQQCQSPSRFYVGEIAYQMLSLVSKGCLGLVLIFNVLVLSNFEEIFGGDSEDPYEAAAAVFNDDRH